MPEVVTNISIEQIAIALRKLKDDEIETLEFMLNSDIANEIDRRLDDIVAGKVKTLSFDEMESFKDLD